MCESAFSFPLSRLLCRKRRAAIATLQTCLCLTFCLASTSSWAQTHAPSQSDQGTENVMAADATGGEELDTQELDTHELDTKHLDTIELKSGDVLLGTITEQTAQTITLKHPILGAITLQRDQTTTHTTFSATADDATANSIPETQTQQVDQADRTGQANQRHQTITAIQTQAQQDQANPNTSISASNGLIEWFKQWSHNIEASFTGAEGASRSIAFLVGYKAKRDSESDRTNFNTRYYKFENRQDQSNQEKAHFEIQQDWLINDSNWFPFVRGRWDYDNNQYWQNRYQGFAGLGYTLAQNQDMEANLRIAGGVTREEHGEDTTRLESLLSAAVVRWQIDDQQSIAGSISIYPQMEDLHEFRLTTELEYRIEVESIEGLSVRFGVENEHQSFIEDGSKNDMLYYAGIGYAF